jgi:hypothetical protein
MAAVGSSLETFRSLRREIESSILPLATSVDGRRFTFQSAVEGLELRLGGCVTLEGESDAALGRCGRSASRPSRPVRSA